MTAREIDDMLIAQRRLMWALPPDERNHRLAEVRADYEYEADLETVAAEMAIDPESDESDDGTSSMIVVVYVEVALLVAGAALIWVLL